jgi:predicted AAA+ superfamily ATPase
VKRESFEKINQLLGYFPAVVILGPRQAGKTTLAKALRPTWRYIDLDNPADISQLINQDPVFYLNHYSQDLIIDEAQSYPEIFNILRGVIDNNRGQKGRFILTGSSSPDLLREVSNSLAGRVAIVNLETFSATELAGFQRPAFYEGLMAPSSALTLEFFKNFLIEKEQENPKINMTKETLYQSWLRGGYPEPVLSKDSQFFDFWMSEYQKTYLFRDVARLFPRLNQQAYQRFLNILARLSGTILNKSDLSRSIEVSLPTITDYLQIAEGTFLWRSIPSFDRHPLRQIVKMPKGHFRDSGLLNYLLHIRSLDDLLNHPHVGHLFESFVIESIMKHLEASSLTNIKTYYYRTKHGAEIDFILEGSFGLLPIEIKLGEVVSAKQLITLKSFMAENGCLLGLVINQGKDIKPLSENILQIPVRYLA